MDLLIDREHDRMGRQIDAEANHVHHFLGELRILGELEGADAVWLKAMRLPLPSMLIRTPYPSSTPVFCGLNDCISARTASRAARSRARIY